MLSLCYLYGWAFFALQVYIPGFAYIIKDNYPDPGIYEAEEFPADGKVRIPKIIHQTWKTRHIPSQYVEWMRSWSKNHPDWKYMFWTDEAARDFIAEKYPHILPAYDGYLENIRRADAMRYAILHEYGGVYADLDMESLLPIDSIIRKYSCILPQEPYEHPIIDSNTEHLVINALMACRPKHPLMKKYVDNIPKYFHMWNVLDSTGPHYITLLYNEYVSSKQLSPTHKDGVYLAPAEYFFPTIDPAKFSYMKERCLNFENMSFLQKRGCVALKLRGLKRKPYAFSFTVHHWVHTYLHSKLFESYYDIFEIIPYAIIRKSEGYVYHMVQ